MSSSILVIEDDPASRELAEYLLTAQGYEVTTAERGDDGFELAREHRPDLILCDIQLPGLDGYAIAQLLKQDESLAHIPIIAVTALAMVGDRERVISAGFDSYIAKPIDPGSFAATIAPFLGQATQVSSPRSAATHRAVGNAPACGITLVAIDDLPANLELTRSIFEPLGYIVLTAETARDGLLLAAERLPQLVVTDIDLPDITGFELLRKMKADERLRDIPVLVVTATYTEASARQTALSFGATAFLARPVEPRIMIGVVESCLQTGGARWQAS